MLRVLSGVQAISESRGFVDNFLVSGVQDIVTELIYNGRLE